MRLATRHQKGVVEAGCDEAGRGCLAGPVVAAAVILPPRFRHKWLNDSKKLTEAQRDELRPIIERKAIAWGVGIVDQHEIDTMNILNASFEAMHRAIAQLDPQPEALLIDGNRFRPYPNIPHTCMIKGDGRFKNIAAASILAKTHRDELMQELHGRWPQYGWDRNKGYPTQEHRQAIRDFGETPVHRLSFRLLPDQLELQFD